MDPHIHILDVGGGDLSASRSGQFDRGKLFRRLCGRQKLSERYGAEKKFCVSRNMTVIV